MNVSAWLRILESRERAFVSGIFTVAFLALLLHALASPIDRYGPDGEKYERMGWETAQSNGLFACGNFDHAYWSPGWIATVAVVYRAAGREPRFVRVLLVVFVCVTGFVTYRLARPVVRPAAAMLAVLLFFFSTLQFRYTVYYQYEPVLALLLALCAWTVSTPDVARTAWWRTTAGGVALGWAALISPRVLALLPLVGLCIAFASSGRRWRIASFALGIAVVLVPWTIRNHRCYGEWIFTTTNGGVNLYIANNANATGDYYLPPPDARPPFALYDSAAWQREAYRYVVDHPVQTLARALEKALRFWTPHYGDQALVLVLVLAGWLRWWRGRPWPLTASHLWILGVPFALTVVHMVFFVQVRYMIPVLPFACVVAGAGAAGWLRPAETTQSRR